MRRALLLIVLACSDGTDGPATRTAQGALRFTDVTAASGLGFSVRSGRVPATQILEVKGGGLGLLDYDSDGDLDVFVPNGATLDAPARGPGVRLFRNEGGLRFVDVTRESGIDLRRWGMGVAVADVDGDGRDDLYVSCFGPNALLRNEGDGRFVEVGAPAGVDHPGWSMGAAFGDVDGDGDLDLYVTNFLAFDPAAPPPPDTFKGVPVFGGPRGLSAQADALYLNRGDGSFEDATQTSGIGAVAPAFGLGVAILDIDADGRQEIFVGNDSGPNALFDDEGSTPGRFVDRGPASGLASNAEGSHQATMGIAIGDVDGNGLPDVFTTNFSSDTNTLHRNADGRFFDDRTSVYGLRAGSQPFVSWATGLFDLDHDGDEDLIAFNGHTYPHASLLTMDSPARQAPLLYAREDDRFRRVTVEESGGWLGEAHVDRGAAFGDLDGDGDVDVVVVELNGPLRVLRNDGAPGDWLIVSLQDERPGAANRRGLGARIEVSTPARTWTRWLVSGTSYLSSSAPSAHVGLGANCPPVVVRVTWPDGFEQTVEAVLPGQQLVIRRDG